MDKKAADFTTITKIVFILIIIIIVMISGGRILWDAGKAGLGFFGLLNISETDYSGLNQNAKSSFNLLISEIKQCRASLDNDCLCASSLSGFDSIHEIRIGEKEIKLINVKDENDITMEKENLNDFNCYYSKSGISTESTLILNFDEELPRIKKSGGARAFGLDFATKDVQFYKTPKIYKSNKMCLTSTDFDLTKISKICKI